MESKPSLPKLPANQWWALREQFKKSIPPTVDVAYLKSYLKIVSDKTAINLLPTLRQFRLIDDKGRPTPLANEWRLDERYPDVCAEIIRQVYPAEMVSLFNGSDVDRNKLKAWIMRTLGVGTSSANQLASTYLLLHTPLDKTKERVVDGRPRVSQRRVQRKAAVATAPTISVSKPISGIVEVASSSPGPGYEDLSLTTKPIINLQIHISPEASAEQIDLILASIARHLNRR